MKTEVTACYVIRGTDSRGNPWMTREFIWPSCDSPAHRKYVECCVRRSAARMNAAGASVSVHAQELVDDLWKDVSDSHGEA